MQHARGLKKNNSFPVKNFLPLCSQHHFWHFCAGVSDPLLTTDLDKQNQLIRMQIDSKLLKKKQPPIQQQPSHCRYFQMDEHINTIRNYRMHCQCTQFKLV